MFDIIKSIKRFRAIPSLLSNSSIYSLESYIMAYEDIVRELKWPISEQHQQLKLFLVWLTFDKYKDVGKNLPWSSRIIFDTDNEKEALDKFFELWDEFLCLHNRNDVINTDE